MKKSLTNSILKVPALLSYSHLVDFAVALTVDTFGKEDLEGRETSLVGSGKIGDTQEARTAFIVHI